MSSTTLTIFSAFFGLLPLLVLVFIFVFVISIFRRVERLKIEKESAQLQQQQIQEINKRLTTIETILKQVD